MQQRFDELRAFDYQQSEVYLWVFKKSTTANRFKARHVKTDDNLNDLLRSMAASEMGRLIEFSQYTHLAETNENSCLTLPTIDSNFIFLKQQVDRPEPENLVRSIEDLKGAQGYVVKFTCNNLTVYAIKKSTNTWKTSYPKKFINMIFQNGELSAAQDNGFAIEKNFDYYVLNDIIFIAGKRAFESAMEHRTSYAQAFTGLSQNPQFSSLFTDIQPLLTHVGTNSIQLRRMATVEQKGLFIQPNFLTSLQRVNAQRGWGINFDPTTNRIVPCNNTVKTILQVLLDHRLMSEVTSNIYDVPDAVKV